MPRLFVVFLALGLSASLGCWHREVRDLNPGDPEPAHRESPPAAPPEAAPEIEVAGEAVPVVDPLPIPDYLQKGIRWLAEAQHESGGWGAGSHSRQHIRNPHEVKTDPATTAFAAQALLRAGHTPVSVAL